MNATFGLEQLTEDLAAHWTDPVLEMVAMVASPYVSIELELRAWHVVKEVLQAELQWQRAFRQTNLVSLPRLMERVLRKSVEQLTLDFMPHGIPAALRMQIRRLASDRRSTGAERVLYARMIREPSLRLAFKPPSRSDLTPRLRVSSARI